MDHADFRIGQEFWFSDRLWRCTDVGQRVIVAIRIDEVTAVRMALPTKIAGRFDERPRLPSTENPCVIAKMFTLELHAHPVLA